MPLGVSGPQDEMPVVELAVVLRAERQQVACSVCAAP
jgi:hypothetical protein